MINSISELESYKNLKYKNFDVRLAQIQDFQQICELESESYPKEEAAKPETIKFRLEKATAYFYVLYCESADNDKNNNQSIVGFINATRSENERLTNESMKEHNEGKFQ